MKKIKILQSVGSLGLGGNEIFVINLFRNINKERFEIDFVVFDDERLDFYEEITNAGSKVYFCTSKKKNKLLRAIDESLQVKKILNKKHYNIIHCHSCSFFGILRSAIPGYLVRGTYVIAHAHNPGIPKKTVIDRIIRSLLRTLTSTVADYGFSCSDIAGQSKYTKNFMRSEKYILIHNAVTVEDYIYNKNIRSDVRKELNISDKEFVIGHVGRFEQQKNHNYLIDIFEEFNKFDPKSKLLLIGTGSLFGEIQKKVSEKNLESKVIFKGQQDSAKRYYHAMDCFLLPSFYEGFPFVLVEAQINGLKSIVSDTITKTVNISGGVSFISIEENAEKWAKSIMNNGRDRMTQSQINKVCDLYDLRKETQRMEKIYSYLQNKGFWK